MSYLSRLGALFTDHFKKLLPDAYVFALLLTLITAVVALIWANATPMAILESWYTGFWNLLEFGMQMVLLIVTGYCIALSTSVEKIIDKVSHFFKTPTQVYYWVVLVGFLLAMVSWGWVVITAVLAREIARRVKGINYPFLIACVYFSQIAWVTGFSSSIPLLLNTERNYLIEGGILGDTIPTSLTLGSVLNVGMILTFLFFGPVLMRYLAPGPDRLTDSDGGWFHAYKKPPGIEKEAEATRLPGKALSDLLNHSLLIQYLIAFMGLVYIVYYFYDRGIDLNLNIMIFIFLILGLFLHKTPMRYSIAMRHASGNISGIIFQYPFYAGIMGIMTYTGIGASLGELIASAATPGTYPVYAYLLGGMVNFAIPSAGGEFAVIGPSVIEAVNQLGAGLSDVDRTAMIARASLAVAYGEGLTNLLQPFFLLLVLPVMTQGSKIQARDVMGFLVLPFLVFFAIQLAMVVWLPL